MDAQPAVIFDDLFADTTRCMPDGLLVNELRGLERLSARALMLAVERRTGRALRLSDVLRYVTEEFACFDVDDTLGEDNNDENESDSDSDSDGDSDSDSDSDANE
jgi:hypothetical protein